MSGQIQYGLWDSKEKCWLGDDNGPWSNPNWDLARLAAAVASEQLDIYVLPERGLRTRQRVRPHELPKDKLHDTGEIKTRMGTLAALQNLEGFCEL